MQEVRRQFREHPGIMDRTEKPEYGQVIDICTTASLRELATPALLAVLTPVIIGFGINYLALGAFLAAVILTGQLMANFLSNSGGAWDNAKKYIEDGHEGGKGSEAHKAAVIGDTVGDPFKDTAGPALNPLIKVMNLVSLLILPAVISLRDNDGARFAIAGAALLVLAIAIAVSKRRAPGLDAGEAAVVAAGAPVIASGERDTTLVVAIDEWIVGARPRRARAAGTAPAGEVGVGGRTRSRRVHRDRRRSTRPPTRPESRPLPHGRVTPVSRSARPGARPPAAPPPPLVAVWRRWRRYSIPPPGTNDRMITTAMIGRRYRSTLWMWSPSSKPSMVTPPAQSTPPTTLKIGERAGLHPADPGHGLANVRTIGMKRAITIVLAPFRAK